MLRLPRLLRWLRPRRHLHGLLSASPVRLPARLRAPPRRAVPGMRSCLPRPRRRPLRLAVRFLFLSLRSRLRLASLQVRTSDPSSPPCGSRPLRPHASFPRYPCSKLLLRHLVPRSRRPPSRRHLPLQPAPRLAPSRLSVLSRPLRSLHPWMRHRLQTTPQEVSSSLWTPPQPCPSLRLIRLEVCPATTLQRLLLSPYPAHRPWTRCWCPLQCRPLPCHPPLRRLLPCLQVPHPQRLPLPRKNWTPSPRWYPSQKLLCRCASRTMRGRSLIPCACEPRLALPAPPLRLAPPPLLSRMAKAVCPPRSRMTLPSLVGGSCAMY